MGDKITNALLLIVGLVFVGVIILPVIPQIMQEIRGPSTDLKVNAEFDSNGYITQYRIVFKMPDAYSYDRFLQHASSQGNSTIREYLLRGIPQSQVFDYEYNQKDLRITLWAKQSFNPNNVTNTIRINKQENTWRYEDSSFEKAYFIPDSFINSITYTLKCPTEIINTNADSRGKLLSANQLTWTIDRHKDEIGSSTKRSAIPTVYADVKVPETPEMIVVPGFCSISAIIGVFAIILLSARKRR